VAIVQISQITNRKGLSSNLPQLAGAELGWSTDTRQLWIGNGTVADGAPVIGNTEILTEFSDILNLSSAYTYQGASAGYVAQTGVTAGTPVTQSLQTWMDQFATVKDFGAVGDGVTDDTAAINRALYQLFCREVNPQIRRSLFFPAGVYLVTGCINIPPYATLWGEGNDNSIIAMNAGVNDYVARTADSLQNVGIDIGNAGATTPQYITIANMGFTNLNATGSVMLVQDATNCTFQNVGFRGASTKTNLVDTTNNSIGVSFASTSSLVCKQITFDGCVFSGLVWGIYANQQTEAVTICNSQFNILYQGVALGAGTTTNGGPTGTRIVSNMFDNVYTQGIVFGGNLGLGINASGHNIFYDVGNHFTSSTGTPYTSIINILSNNNVSISDLFQRTDSFATVHPRVDLNTTLSIATTNGQSMSMGTYTRQSGQQGALNNGASGTVVTLSAATNKTFMIDYGITRGTTYRTGTIMIATAGGTGQVLNFTDTNYAENDDTGITLNVAQNGTTVTLDYTATNLSPAVNGTISYSVRSLI
jgi:hypothetical protein